MFEALITNVLNKVLGEYIDNLEQRQLNVGLFSGNVLLNGLQVKNEAIDKLDLPIELVHGYLGTLELHIPWTNLKSQPVSINIKDLFILIKPKTRKRLSESELKAIEDKKFKAKINKLETMELLIKSSEAAKSQKSKNENEEGNSTFFSLLITKIIDNLQISIENIHIRYEDLTREGNFFTVGIMLKELSAVSTDSNWNPTFLANPELKIHKLLKLTELSIYWNKIERGKNGKGKTEINETEIKTEINKTDQTEIKTETEMETDQTETEMETDQNNDSIMLEMSLDSFLESCRKLVMQRDYAQSKLQYLLEPVSGYGRGILWKKFNKDQPKNDFEFFFDQFIIKMNHDQYHDLLVLLNKMVLDSRSAMYLDVEYYPYSSIPSSPILSPSSLTSSSSHQSTSLPPSSLIESQEIKRFKFAISCILRDIQLKNKRKTWSFVIERLRDCRRYIELYSLLSLSTGKSGSISLSSSGSPSLTSSPSTTVSPVIEFELLEKKYEYEDLLLLRGIARNQMKKRQKILLTQSASNSGSSAGSSNRKTSVDNENSNGGWFSRWLGFNRGNENEEGNGNGSSGEIIKEKDIKELYETIDYDEESDQTSSNLSLHAQLIRIKCRLDTCAIKILDDPSKLLMELIFSDMNLVFLQRPESIRVEFGMKDISLNEYLLPNCLFSKLIRSKNSVMGNNIDNNSIYLNGEISDKSHDFNDSILSFIYDQLPNNRNAKAFIGLAMSPLEIILNHQVFDLLREYFIGVRVRDAFDDLTNTTQTQINYLKARTRANLEYRLHEHKAMEVSFNIGAPLLIAPLDATKSHNSPLMIFDLGKLKVESRLVTFEQKAQISSKKHFNQSDIDELLELMYDVLQINIDSLCVSMIPNAIDWIRSSSIANPDLISDLNSLNSKMKLESGLESENTKTNLGINDKSKTDKINHDHDNIKQDIIKNLNLQIDIATCIVEKTISLPAIKIKGQIPKIEVDFSDEKYRVFMKILDCLLPSSSPSNSSNPSSPKLPLTLSESPVSPSSLSLQAIPPISSPLQNQEIANRNQDERGEISSLSSCHIDSSHSSSPFASNENSDNDESSEWTKRESRKEENKKTKGLKSESEENSDQFYDAIDAETFSPPPIISSPSSSLEAIQLELEIIIEQVNILISQGKILIGRASVQELTVGLVMKFKLMDIQVGLRSFIIEQELNSSIPRIIFDGRTIEKMEQDGTVDNKNNKNQDQDQDQDQSNENGNENANDRSTRNSAASIFSVPANDEMEIQEINKQNDGNAGNEKCDNISNASKQIDSTFNSHILPLFTTSSITRNEGLLKVRVVLIDQDHPDYYKAFKGTDIKINVDISFVRINLFPHCLMQIVKYIIDTFAGETKEEEIKQQQKEEMQEKGKEKWKEMKHLQKRLSKLDSNLEIQKELESEKLEKLIKIKVRLSRLQIAPEGLGDLDIRRASMGILVDGPNDYIQVQTKLRHFSFWPSKDHVDDHLENMFFIQVEGDSILDVNYERRMKIDKEKKREIVSNINLKCGSFHMIYMPKLLENISKFIVKLTDSISILNENESENEANQDQKKIKEADNQEGFKNKSLNSDPIQSIPSKLYYNIDLCSPIIDIVSRGVNQYGLRDFLSLHLGRFEIKNNFIVMESILRQHISLGIFSIHANFFLNGQSQELIKHLDAKLDILQSMTENDNKADNVERNKIGKEGNTNSKRDQKDEIEMETVEMMQQLDLEDQNPEMEIQGKISQVTMTMTDEQYGILIKLFEMVMTTYPLILEPLTRGKEKEDEQEKERENSIESSRKREKVIKTGEILFIIEKIKLELLTVESVLNSDSNSNFSSILLNLAELSIQNVNLAMMNFSDSSQQLNLQVESVQVVDTRKDQGILFRDLMNFSPLHSSSLNHNLKTMISLSKMVNSTGESSINISINSPRILLIIEHIFALKDYFNPVNEKEIKKEKDENESGNEMKSNKEIQSNNFNETTLKRNEKIERESSLILSITNAEIFLLENARNQSSEALSVNLAAILFTQKPKASSLTLDGILASFCNMDHPKDTRIQFIDTFDCQITIEDLDDALNIFMSSRPIVARLSWQDLEMITSVMRQFKIEEKKDKKKDKSLNVPADESTSLSINSPLSQPQNSNPSSPTLSSTNSIVIRQTMQGHVELLNLTLIDDCTKIQTPILEIDIPSFSFDLFDWSSNMKGSLQISSLRSFYFNLQNSEWEPLVEPWSLSLKLDSEGGKNSTYLIESKEILNINLSRVFLDLYSQASQRMSMAIKKPASAKRTIAPPYKIINRTGYKIQVSLPSSINGNGSNNNAITPSNANNSNSNSPPLMILENNSSRPWDFGDDTVRIRRNIVKKTKINILLLDSPWEEIRNVPLNEHGIMSFSLRPHLSPSFKLIVEPRIVNGTREITIRSPILFLNNSREKIEIQVVIAGTPLTTSPNLENTLNSSSQSSDTMSRIVCLPGQLASLPIAMTELPFKVRPVLSDCNYEWNEENISCMDLFNSFGYMVCCIGGVSIMKRDQYWYGHLRGIPDILSPLDHEDGIGAAAVVSGGGSGNIPPAGTMSSSTTNTYPLSGGDGDDDDSISTIKYLPIASTISIAVPFILENLLPFPIKFILHDRTIDRRWDGGSGMAGGTSLLSGELVNIHHVDIDHVISFEMQMEYGRRIFHSTEPVIVNVGDFNCHDESIKLMPLKTEVERTSLGSPLSMTKSSFQSQSLLSPLDGEGRGRGGNGGRGRGSISSSLSSFGIHPHFFYEVGQNGGRKVSIYSPYVIMNQTGFSGVKVKTSSALFDTTIGYGSGAVVTDGEGVEESEINQNVNEEDEINSISPPLLPCSSVGNVNGMILFSYADGFLSSSSSAIGASGGSGGGRKRVKICIKNMTGWSSSISLDAYGTTTPFDLDGHDEYGNEQSFNFSLRTVVMNPPYHLCKMVKILPRYLLVNETPFPLELLVLTDKDGEVIGGSNRGRGMIGGDFLGIRRIVQIPPNEYRAVHMRTDYLKNVRIILLEFGDEIKPTDCFDMDDMGRIWLKTFHNSNSLNARNLISIERTIREEGSVVMACVRIEKQWPFTFLNQSSADLKVWQWTENEGERKEKRGKGRYDSSGDDKGSIDDNIKWESSITEHALLVGDILNFAWDIPSISNKKLACQIYEKKFLIDIHQIGTHSPIHYKLPGDVEWKFLQVLIALERNGSLLVTFKDYENYKTMSKKKKSNATAPFTTGTTMEKEESIDENATIATITTTSSALYDEKSSILSEMKTSCKVQLAGIGISLIDANLREIIYIYMKGIEFHYNFTNLHTTFGLSLDWIQIDNQSYDYEHPILLYPTCQGKREREREREKKEREKRKKKEENEGGREIERERAFLEMAAIKPTATSPLLSEQGATERTKWNEGENEFISSSSVDYFKYFSLLLQETSIELDEEILRRIIDFLGFSTPSSTSEEIGNDDEIGNYNKEKNENENNSFIEKKRTRKKSVFMRDQDSLRSSITEARKGKRGGHDQATLLYFEIFQLHPIILNLSFSKSEGKRSASDNSVIGIANPITALINAFIATVSNVSDAPLKFNSLILEHPIVASSMLLELVQTHYKQQALSQIHKILGSADIVGNPVGLFNSLGSGVTDLFYEPYLGIVSDRPQDFGIGLAKGGISFVKKSVVGLTDTLSKITGSMSKGLSAATMDESFQQKRRINRMRNKPKHALVGVVSGAKHLYTGFKSGIQGIVEKPLDGAKESGVSGFFKGVGVGLLGVVTKPLVGILDMTTSLTEGIRNTADTDSTELEQVRLPRAIPPDNILKCYDSRAAFGQSILTLLEQEHKIRPDSRYISHIDCIESINAIDSVTDITFERKEQLERETDREIKSLSSIYHGVLLITTRRLIKLGDNNETMEWCVMLADIVNLKPNKTDGEISIVIRRPKKKSHKQRIIKCSKEQIEWAIGKIEEAIVFYNESIR